MLNCFPFYVSTANVLLRSRDGGSSTHRGSQDLWHTSPLYMMAQDFPASCFCTSFCTLSGWPRKLIQCRCCQRLLYGSVQKIYRNTVCCTVTLLFFPSIFHLWMIVCGYRGLNHMHNISLSKLSGKAGCLYTHLQSYVFTSGLSSLQTQLWLIVSLASFPPNGICLSSR